MKRALVLILSLALVMCIAIPALAADDVVIYDFTNTADVDDTFGFNTGLTTSFGVPAPTNSIISLAMASPNPDPLVNVSTL